MRTLIIGLFCTFLLGVFSGCKTESTVSATYEHVKLFAEGPLFEGANTLQGQIETKLEQFIKDQDVEVGDIVSARLKSVTLSTTNDSSNFDLLSSISIQFASDKTDMVKVALLNPVPPGSKTLELKVATEQKDLLEVLKQDQFTVVADALLTRDTDANMELEGSFEFELTYKK